MFIVPTTEIEEYNIIDPKPLEIQEEPKSIAVMEEKLEESVEEKVEENLVTKTLQLCEDKWEQLSNIYQHINPFKDEREYLSIGPNDFVILK